MKDIIREMAKNSPEVDRYLKDECLGQAEAACKMIIFDIIQIILKDETLGNVRIDLIKTISTKYNLNI